LSKYEELNDLALFEKIYQKDSDALEELYERYSPLLYTLLKKITKDERTAEIILSEVFVIVWRKVGLFNFKTGNVFTWLVILTRNRAIDSLKRSRNSSESLDNYNDKYENFFIIPFLDKRIDSLDLKTAMSIKPKMEQALEKLTDAQKYVLHLSFYEGYNLGEIAKKLNIPIETVRDKVMTTVHNLRDNLIGG
jgi:RNA polymerase sigma-70 factor (ECF subfamily)